MNGNAKRKSQFNYDRVALSDVVPLSTPLVIYVEPSSLCNLKCKFCPHGDPEAQFYKGFMPLNIYDKILLDLKEFPDKIKKIRFCGTGEPLLNRNFPAMVLSTRNAGVAEYLELVTNGLLLQSVDANALLMSLDRIILSIEGLTSSDYLKYSGRSIEYSLLLDGIKLLYGSKNRKAVIHVKIHSEAVSEDERLNQFYDIFSRYCDEISVERLVDQWPEINESYLLSSEAHRFGGRPGKVIVCPQIFKSLQVNANGYVIPCCVDWSAKNILGNITSTSLKEIWGGKVLRELRVKHLKGRRFMFSPCNSCQMNEYTERDNIDCAADEILHKL